MRLAPGKKETALWGAFFVDAKDSTIERDEGSCSNGSVRLSGDKGKKKYWISLLFPYGKIRERLSFLCFLWRNALLAWLADGQNAISDNVWLCVCEGLAKKL